MYISDWDAYQYYELNDIIDLPDNLSCCVRLEYVNIYCYYCNVITEIYHHERLLTYIQ